MKAVAFLNSSVALSALSFMSPTLNFEGGQVRALPFFQSGENAAELGKRNISISKEDYDSQETSWDFKRSPLV